MTRFPLTRYGLVRLFINLAIWATPREDHWLLDRFYWALDSLKHRPCVRPRAPGGEGL